MHERKGRLRWSDAGGKRKRKGNVFQQVEKQGRMWTKDVRKKKGGKDGKPAKGQRCGKKKGRGVKKEWKGLPSRGPET